jgi:hypothetical protein
VQPTQHTTATETSEAQTADTEAAARACGIAFLRALSVLRDIDAPVDLAAFQDNFDEFLAEQQES